jgi:hypothetical protein
LVEKVLSREMRSPFMMTKSVEGSEARRWAIVEVVRASWMGP